MSRLGLVFVLGLFIACQRSDPPRAPHIITDSAGVSIVDNRTPIFQSAEYLRIDTEPMFELDTAYLHGSYGHPMVLMDGRILLLDPSIPGFRLFDSTGRHLRQFGRMGAGPGEFQYFRAHGVDASDSILVFDSDQRRTSILDSEGRFARQAMQTDGLPNPPFVMLTNRTFVAKVPSVGSSTGIYRDPRGIVVVDPEGKTVGRAGGYRSAEYYRTGDGRSTPNECGIVFFSHNTMLSVVDTLIAIGDNALDQFDLWAPNGRLLVRSGRNRPDQVVTDDDVEREREALIATDPPEMREEARKDLASCRHAKHRPYFDELVGSTEGEVWVRDYQSTATADSSQRFEIFDSKGRWLASATVPGGMTVEWIGKRILLAASETDEGRRIRAYRIHRNAVGEDSGSNGSQPSSRMSYPSFELR